MATSHFWSLVGFLCAARAAVRGAVGLSQPSRLARRLVGRVGRVALLGLLGLSAGAAHAFDLQFNTVTDIDPAVTNGVLQYTIQIENSGFGTATDVQTVFAVPEGASVEGGALALPAAANANCSQSGAYVVCTHGGMDGTGGGGGTPPISFTLRFRAPALLPAPPNVRLRGAIGRGAPPLGTVQAHPAAFFPSGSAFWAGDTNENNNAQSPLQQTTLENNADLSVAVSVSTNPVVSGARLTYTVTVTNNGPTSNPTSGVRVRNTLPAGATFVGSTSTDAGWSFSGPAGGVLTATRGTQVLAVGASVTFTFQVDVTITSGTLSNTAEVDTDRSVGGALLDNIVANNTASVATGVSVGADVSVLKTLTSGAGPYTAGATLGLRLAPRNGGTSSASNVVLRDELPSGHTLAAAFPLPPTTLAFGSYTCRTNAANQNDLDGADAGRAARSILRCTRASLPVGDSENIDFSVVIGAGVAGSVSNTASVSASTADPVPGNNSSSVNYTVQLDGADIELINFDKGPNLVAAAGGVITNSVRVRNNGPRAVDGNLQVFVTLAAGESFLAGSAGWACGAEAGGVRCTYTGAYPVASGAISGSAGFADLVFTTQASAAGSLTSSVCVGGTGGSAEATVGGFAPGSTTDFVVGNDCSATRTITATNQVSDLTLSKLTSTPLGGDKILGAGETSVNYTLTVTNLGPTTTTGVVLRDTLPGYVGTDTVVSICGYTGAGACVPPLTDNFPATIGAFTCTRAAGQVLCSSGSNAMAVGAGNAATFVIRMSGAIRDSLAAAGESGCSVAGQYCNLAFLGIDSSQPGSAFEPNINNNLGQDTLLVHANANIQTQSKTFSPLSAQAGVDTDYTINYRNPASSRSDLPALASPPAGAPAGVVFVDTFTLAANDPGFVLRSATIVSGAACSVAGVTGGVGAAAAAGGTSYATTGGAAGTVRIECPAVTMPRSTDRQVRITVRPNIGSVGPLVNTASFRFVDSGGNTVSASGATYDLNNDTSAADDTQTANVPFVVGQVDLRVENTDLQDPASWDPAAVGTSPGGSDIVYRVQVRNGGPSLASGTRIDYTLTPPAGATLRFIGDEAGAAVTLAAGATVPQRCVVFSGSNPVLAPASLTLRCTSPGFGFTPAVDGVLSQGTLAEDGAFLNIRVRFESTPAPSGSTVSTNAVVSSVETELDPSNNAEAEVTTVRTRADLAISKTGFTAAVPALPAALPAAVATVGLGQPFNWVVDVVNNGPGDALSVDRTGANPASGLGVVITDTLPAGVTVTGPITWQKIGSSSFPGAVVTGNGSCVLAGLAVTCNTGDVANGGRVRVTLPVRWDVWPGAVGSVGNLSGAQTNQASTASEQVDPVGANNSVSHAVNITRSSLTGVVFEDRDRLGANAGTQQTPAADPPLANVTVVLRAAGGVDAYGNPFAARTTLTDVNGVYRFDDLPAATFEVVQAQPIGTSNSPGDPTAAAAGVSPSLGGTYAAAGANPAGAPVPAGANSRYTGVVLGAQQDGVRYNFPEVLDGALAPDLAISKTGFTAAVPALPAALPAAVTTVGLAQPFNWVVDVVNNGPGDALSVDRSGSSPLNGLGAVITDTLPAGVTVTGPITWQKVGSSSFPGAVATGSGTCALVGLAVTCRVGDVANGGRVRVTLPVRWDAWPGSTGSTSNISAAQTNNAIAASEQLDPVGTNNSASHAVNITRSSLAGVVFEDRDRAGANAGTPQSAAADPPLANVTVVLRAAGGVDAYGNPFTARTTTTDVNGAYRFDDLPAATFELVEVQPTNTANSPGDPTAAAAGTSPSLGGVYAATGADPAGAPVPAGANSRYSGVVLGAQQDGVRYNFPEVLADTPTPNLVVSKSLSPAALTELNRASYSITVRNAGTLASSGVYTVTDTLPAGITAVAVRTGTTAGSNGGNVNPGAGSGGWVCSVAGQSITCTSSVVIAAGDTNPSAITLDVQAGQNLCPTGYPCSLNNAVAVSGGGEPPALQPSTGELTNPPVCTTPATQNVCRLPTPIQQAGGVSGLVWLDGDHDRRFAGGADVRLGGVKIELYQAGALLRSTTTDAQGQYQLLGLVPGSDYEIRFRDPVTGAYYGRPVSTDPAGGNDPRATGAAGVVPDGSLQGFVVPGGNAVRVNQNLPLDPSGVVYDSQTRQPVGGALVEFLGPNGQPVPAQCVLGGVNRITTAITTPTTTVGSVPGGYAFWLVAPAPVGCPGDGNYTLRITPPAGYANAGVPSAGSLTATSTLIPAQSGAVQVPGSCQGYVAGAPCAVQNQASAPTGAQATPYFFSVPLAPNSPQAFVDIVNNHIPLDPLLLGSRFVISKQASRATAEVGDAVSYTIRIQHLQGAALNDVRVDDRLPAGFRYVPGTFRVGANLRADPAGAPGPNLRFDVGTLPVNGLVSFTYVTRAGVGAQQGDGINTAQAFAGLGAAAVQSNVAKARVRITGGVFGADACVVGKVYVDCNHNQIQDREELGIPGVRLLLQDGTNITSDSEGKYSLCGLPPRTHVLKADLLTLPRGSRLVTSSSRNAGDAHSIFVDLKNGELQRADFIEGSCSNTVLEQVKARRTQGEVRAVETEKKGGPALKFEGKAPSYPPQGTDSANQQPAVRPRENAPNPRPPVKDGVHEQNVPVPALPAASPNTQRQ